MRYLLNTKPAAGAGTDTVFYLSYLPLGSKVASTVWVVYRAVHVMAPWPQFYAALINDPNDHPFLIFVESNTKGSSFSIYKVDLAKRLADASPQLNPERKEEWPRPAEALSSVSYGISKTEVLSGCYFSAIDAAWKNNTITVEARRNPEVCGSLLTSFDVNSAKWADVQRSDTGK